jgi:phage shock protein PspC (stress-responsive transcriptional regulator)
MQKVVTVSLNGNAYQLEEDGYAQLAAYLDASARALATNPDRAEIISDLEQAIGEKCARYLNAHKTVISSAELQQVIAEMGPVDPGVGESGASAQARPSSDHDAVGGSPNTGPGATSSAPRRLYQISEGALVSGVCNGIAAYLGVDVTLVRITFIAVTLLTGGAALLGYLVLMFIVPYANTSEEHAAARGLPFNARMLVERAKQKYAEFTHRTGNGAAGSRPTWREEWRRGRALWHAERRRARAQWRAYRRGGRGPVAPPPAGPEPAPVAYGTYVLTGTLVAVFGFLYALLTIGWLLAVLSLLATGALFGWALPQQLPFWVALIVLIVLYRFVAWPLKAMRNACFSVHGFYGAWIAAWDGIVSLAIVATLIWFAYHHGPELHEFLNRFGQWWHGAAVTSGSQPI